MTDPQMKPSNFSAQFPPRVLSLSFGKLFRGANFDVQGCW